ncbi:hypothetical protein VM98_38175, partial [Streptomyces rubellomurinus subsp. indigoferus]
MRYGEGYVRPVGQEHGPDGGRGHHRWRDDLPATGLAARTVLQPAADAMPADLPAEVAGRLRRRFAEGGWIPCLLPRRQAAAAARPSRGDTRG